MGAAKKAKKKAKKAKAKAKKSAKKATKKAKKGAKKAAKKATKVAAKKPAAKKKAAWSLESELEQVNAGLEDFDSTPATDSFGFARIEKQNSAEDEELLQAGVDPALVEEL